MTFKAYIRAIDIKRAIKGSAEHTKLIKLGYKQSDQYSYSGIKWVEMRKEGTH